MNVITVQYPYRNSHLNEIVCNFFLLPFLHPGHTQMLVHLHSSCYELLANILWYTTLYYRIFPCIRDPSIFRQNFQEKSFLVIKRLTPMYKRPPIFKVKIMNKKGSLIHGKIRYVSLQTVYRLLRL